MSGGLYYPQVWAMLSVAFRDENRAAGRPTFSPSRETSQERKERNKAAQAGGRVAPGTARERPIMLPPKSASIYLNSYKEADSWSLTFDAEMLPFHPDFVQSIGVQIYAFHTPELGGSIQSHIDAGRLEGDNLVIAGVSDSQTLNMGAEGREFTCSGLDYTVMLTTKKWDARERVPVGKTITDTVQDLVDAATRYTTTGQTLSVIHEVADPFEREPTVVGTGSNATGYSFPESSTVWDVITEMCSIQGRIVFVRGFDVVITTPQDQIERAGVEVPAWWAEQGKRKLNLPPDNGASDRWKRALTFGTQLGKRRLKDPPRPIRVAYGRNLSALRFTRNIGGMIAPQVTVRCYDPTSRVTMSGTFPDVPEPTKKGGAKAKHASKPHSGAGEAKTESKVFVVHGVANEGVLAQMAEMMWHHLARGETEIEFETIDLTDLNDAEMLRLRPGDPVGIGFGAGGNPIENLDPGQLAGRLVARGYDDSVAQAIAHEYQELSAVERVFYTSGVNYDWTASGGMRISVNARNYIRGPEDPTQADQSETGGV